ncbi:cell wall surface anchor family protein [Streptococcus pneumoniae]|nr:cell wall surface anchor family protein [Streptococcus pneumoniae]
MCFVVYCFHKNSITLFTVTEQVYLKDVQKNDATKVVNKKITIPQTGGIGTIIFAVAGAVIMGIAVYAYVKNNKDEDQLA